MTTQNYGLDQLYYVIGVAQGETIYDTQSMDTRTIRMGVVGDSLGSFFRHFGLRDNSGPTVVTTTTISLASVRSVCERARHS